MNNELWKIVSFWIFPVKFGNIKDVVETGREIAKKEEKNVKIIVNEQKV